MLIIAVAFALSAAAFAQDVITLRNGDEINGKVTKVSSTEIEYKLASNPDGPTYAKPVSEIFMIKYENGNKDVFNTEASSSQQQQMTAGIPSGVTLERSRGEIVDANTDRSFSDYELEHMLGTGVFNDYVKARDSYNSTKNSLVWAYLFFFLGPPMYYGGVLLETGNGNGLAMRIIGIAWTIGGNIMIPANYITRGVAAGKISRIAEGYNARNGNLGMDISTGFSLMPTANGNVAPGLGITLKF